MKGNDNMPGVGTARSYGRIYWGVLKCVGFLFALVGLSFVCVFLFCVAVVVMPTGNFLLWLYDGCMRGLNGVSRFIDGMEL